MRILVSKFLEVHIVCDFCSSDREFASSFFQIPPRGGRPCSSLIVPAAKSVVDFHHQVVVHAAHTRSRTPHKRSAGFAGRRGKKLAE